MTDTRANRAIHATECPVCHAPRGTICKFTPAERRKLGPRLASLPIHGERRKLWQQARDAERGDLHIATPDDRRHNR